MDTITLVKRVFERDMSKAVISVKKCEEHIFNVIMFLLLKPKITSIR